MQEMLLIDYLNIDAIHVPHVNVHLPTARPGHEQSCQRSPLELVKINSPILIQVAPPHDVGNDTLAPRSAHQPFNKACTSTLSNSPDLYDYGINFFAQVLSVEVNLAMALWDVENLL